MNKISIIIPAYNSEKTIEKSILSALSSSYEKLEILVVNDGSSDGTADLVKRISNSDARVKLISKENGGVSSARNKGLDLASGDIIMFLDADDTYAFEFCEKVVSCYANCQSDLVFAGYREIFNDKAKNVICPFEQEISGKANIRQKIIIDHYQSGLNGYIGAVWCCAFRADLIRQNNIRFHEKIHHGEDKLFLIQYLTYCERINNIGGLMYNYMLGDSSVTKKYSPTIEQNNRMLGEAFEKIYSDISYIPSEETKGKNAVSAVFSLLVNEARPGNPKSIFQQIGYVTSVNKKYRTAIKKMHSTDKKLKIKRMIALHPSLCFLFFFVRRIQRDLGVYF